MSKRRKSIGTRQVVYCRLGCAHIRPSPRVPPGGRRISAFLCPGQGTTFVEVDLLRFILSQWGVASGQGICVQRCVKVSLALSVCAIIQLVCHSPRSSGAVLHENPGSRVAGGTWPKLELRENTYIFLRCSYKKNGCPQGQGDLGTHLADNGYLSKGGSCRTGRGC